MPISNNLTFSGADNYLEAAMSGLAARQRTIANNVANVDTPNFKSSEVNFESTLSAAMQSGAGSTQDQSSLNASTSRATLTAATASRADGNNVDIDREMEILGEANLNFSALTQVMSTRMGILRSVIHGT